MKFTKAVFFPFLTIVPQYHSLGFYILHRSCTYHPNNIFFHLARCTCLSSSWFIVTELFLAILNLISKPVMVTSLEATFWVFCHLLKKKNLSRLLTRNQKAFNKVNIFVFFLFPQNCFCIYQSARKKQASCIVWIKED